MIFVSKFIDLSRLLSFFFALISGYGFQSDDRRRGNAWCFFFFHFFWIENLFCKTWTPILIHSSFLTRWFRVFCVKLNFWHVSEVAKTLLGKNSDDKIVRKFFACFVCTPVENLFDILHNNVTSFQKRTCLFGNKLLMWIWYVCVFLCRLLTNKYTGVQYM